MHFNHFAGLCQGLFSLEHCYNPTAEDGILLRLLLLLTNSGIKHIDE